MEINIKFDVEKSRHNFKKDFVKLMNSKELNEDKLNGLIDSNLDHVKLLTPKMIKKVVAFKETLNEEQRKKLITLFEKHRKDHPSNMFHSSTHW